MARFKASFYNLRIHHGDGVLVYNAATGALLKLQKEIYREISAYLGPERSRKAGIGYSDWSPPIFDAECLSDNISLYWRNFIDSGLFVEASKDERTYISEQYEYGRSASPCIITITPTLNCNMRCYYCYQKDGELDHMSPEICNEAIQWTKEHVKKLRDKRIFVDWYGGEPMLNKEVILQYSREIIPWCDKNQIKYKSHMICNGTNWPENIENFIKDTRLSKIQITLDGTEKFHNKRRSLVEINGTKTRTSSFDTVMSTIDKLLEHVVVYLRINVDPVSGDSCLKLIKEFERRDWFKYKKRFYPYVAIINAMTEHCGFIEKSKIFVDFKPEFERIQHKFYEKLSLFQGVDALEQVEYYPRRKLINCTAVNDNSIIFGPNGLMYKCTLDVGDANRSHNTLMSASNEFKSVVNKKDEQRWMNYDPFTLPTCKECQYLPICYGGCPRAQIDNLEHQIRDQNAFFENSFDKLIKNYYDRGDRL